MHTVAILYSNNRPVTVLAQINHNSRRFLSDLIRQIPRLMNISGRHVPVLKRRSREQMVRNLRKVLCSIFLWLVTPQPFALCNTALELLGRVIVFAMKVGPVDEAHALDKTDTLKSIGIHEYYETKM